MDSQLLQQVDDVKSIRRLRFQLGRGTRTATVFHLKKSLSETSFVVICRSVHFKSVLEDQGDAGGQGTGGGDDASSVGGYDSDVPSIDGGSTSILRKKSSEDILGSVKPRLRRRSMTNLKDDSVNESTPTSRQSSPVREPNAHTRIQSESSGLFQREPSTMSIKSSTSKQNSPVKTGGRTRSASGGKLLDSPSMSDAPSNITVYIFGYLIEPNPTDPNKSRVTLLSSVGSNLAKVTNTITFPSKLKDFIEELVTLTATLSGHDLQDLMEMRRPDARGGRVEKLKSYIGATASYLMKGYAKAKTGKEDLDGETQDGESPAVTDRSVDDRTPTSTVDEELLDPVPEPFNGEEYVDRELDLRQIVRVPLPYLAKPYNQSEPVLVDLTWEFSTRKELPIFFGIEFNPLDGDDDDKLLNRRYDKLASGNYAVIPLCQVSAYAKPICGKLIINDFPSGTFDFIYDNLSPPKRAIRQLTTRAWIQETPQRRFSSISSLDLVPKPLSEYHAEVTVPRKSFYKISFILDSKMEPFIDPSSRIMLSWTLLTGGYDVNLVIFYEEERGAGVTKGQNSSPEQIIPDDDDDDRDVKLRDSKDSPSSTGQSDTIPLDISPGENPDKLVAMSQQGMSSADVPPRLPPRPNATTPESPNRSTVEGRSRVSDDSSSIRSLSPRRRNDEIGEVPQSPKPGSGPASKFAQYLGKAKEVYRDVRTGVVASPVGSQSATTGASASGQTQGKLEQRAKAALSSRLQAVVSKSEDVSRRLKGAYVESRRPSSGPSEASPSEDPLSPSPAVFGLSPQSLTVFPLTKVNTKSSVSFRGSLDLSGGKGKWGLYTLVLDNTGSLLAAKTVTLSVMLGAQYNDGDLLFSNGENDGDVPIGNAIDESL